MQNQFVNLFKKIKATHQNPIISPLGLEILLNLLAEGAEGATRQALEKIIGFSPDLNALENLVARLKELEEIGNQVQIESSNKLYYTPHIAPIDNFFKNLQTKLGLTIEQIPPIGERLAFILENALYLKAFWQQPFNPVPHKTEFFTLANGEELETLFINQSNIYGRNKTQYFKKEHFHAIQLPLKGDRLCVEIYLPYQKDGLDDFLQALTTEDLKAWATQFHKVNRMDIYLPKFEAKLQADFTLILRQLGLDQLFQQSWDFSPMFRSDKTLYVHKLTQDNFFKLNEHGIEASSTSRAYGSIGSLRAIDKFVLFEAAHPFLYLVRDKPADTILFIGVFEAPDKQQNFSLSYHNIKELAKFNQDIIPFSHRFCFAITAYTLESLTTHFKFNNEFINTYIESIWDLATNYKKSALNEKLEKLETLEWPVSFKEMRLTTKLPKDKNHIKNTPRQLISIFYEFQETLQNLLYQKSVDINFSGRMARFCRYVLDTIDCRIPTWESCQNYRQLTNNPWGKPISRSEFLSCLKQPIPRTALNTNQIYIRKQNKIIRNLQPKLFDITIRGKLYIGLICLEKLLEKEPVYPIKLREWLIDLGDFISNEKSTKFDKLVLLRFDMFSQTGFFDKNQYFTKDSLDNFKAEYAHLIDILAGLDGILTSYKYLKASNNYDFSFNSMLDFLQSLVRNKIDLPNHSLFKQFQIKEGNILGKPVKLNKKLLKNYYRIIE